MATTNTIQNFINELLTEQDRYDSLANATPEQRERLRNLDQRAAERARDPQFSRTAGILRGGLGRGHPLLDDALRDLEDRGVQQRVTGALDPGSKGEGDYFGGNEMPRSSNELPRVAPRRRRQEGMFADHGWRSPSNIPQGGQSGRWGGDAEAAPEQPERTDSFEDKPLRSASAFRRRTGSRSAGPRIAAPTGSSIDDLLQQEYDRRRGG